MKKLIYILLISTIILSAILAYKIKKTTSYDSNIYNLVYEEYNQITTNSNSLITNSSNTSSTSSKKTIYLSKNASGYIYRTIAAIKIPKINISYPVINDYSKENLNIAPTKFFGPDPNSIGNFVIVGHNNWNKDFFSNLHQLEIDDIVELTDMNSKTMTYKVYKKYEVKQDDFSCLNQDTNGNIELTLITCIKYQKNKRLIIKCIAT